MTIEATRLPRSAPSRVGCRGCHATGLTDVLRSTHQPALVGTLFETREHARAAATGDIDLAFCHTCGLVQNRSFDPSIVRFAPGYEVSLAHSTTFVSYIDGLARRLVDRYRLRGGRVLEIGCGDGYFIRQLCQHGIREAIGVDPTLPTDGKERRGEARITWRKTLFDPALRATRG